MSGSSKDSGVPLTGRLLGIDFGTKRLGIAISNQEQTISSPLENYTRLVPEVDAATIKELAEEYGAIGLVVGLPVHMSGDEGKQAERAREFGNWLSQTINLPVQFWDERFTSAIAESYLMQSELSQDQRKARLDKLSAQVMLQTFLDAPDRNAPPAAL